MERRRITGLSEEHTGISVPRHCCSSRTNGAVWAQGLSGIGSSSSSYVIAFLVCELDITCPTNCRACFACQKNLGNFLTLNSSFLLLKQALIPDANLCITQGEEHTFNSGHSAALRVTDWLKIAGCFTGAQAESCPAPATKTARDHNVLRASFYFNYHLIHSFALVNVPIGVCCLQTVMLSKTRSQFASKEIDLRALDSFFPMENRVWITIQYSIPKLWFSFLKHLTS